MHVEEGEKGAFEYSGNWKAPAGLAKLTEKGL